MELIGKWIFYCGMGIAFIGLLVIGISKLGIPLGKLPGDVRIIKERFGIYLPIVTSIVLSIVLTLIVNLALWLFNTNKH